MAQWGGKISLTAPAPAGLTVEAAVCRAVLAPLKPVLWMRLRTLRAPELRRLRRRQMALRAGAGPEGQSPALAQRSRIHERLAHLHAACAPRRKVALLLAVCSDVYAGLACSEGQGKGEIGVRWQKGDGGRGLRSPGWGGKVGDTARSRRPGRTHGWSPTLRHLPGSTCPWLPAEPQGADAFLPALTEELIWSPDIGETQLDVEFLMELLDPNELRGEGAPHASNEPFPCHPVASSPTHLFAPSRVLPDYVVWGAAPHCSLPAGRGPRPTGAQQ